MEMDCNVIEDGISQPGPTFKAYIGCKVIKARQMDHYEFLTQVKGQATPDHENSPGYLVEYPDGYISWSPQHVFENAYREVLQGEVSIIESCNM
jgi:hypothetical protein